MKTCSHCKQALPLSDFGSNPNNPDGRQYACQRCRREAARVARARQRAAKKEDEAPEHMRYCVDVHYETPACEHHRVADGHWFDPDLVCSKCGRMWFQHQDSPRACAGATA
jgi:hypothetical protein